MWESQKKIIFSIIDMPTYGSWIKKWNWLKFEAVSSDFKIFAEIVFVKLFIILEPEMKPKMNPETQTQHCKGIR